MLPVRTASTYIRLIVLDLGRAGAKGVRNIGQLFDDCRGVPEA